MEYCSAIFIRKIITTKYMHLDYVIIDIFITCVILTNRRLKETINQKKRNSKKKKRIQRKLSL